MLAALHFFWLVKKVRTEPYWYALVLAVLLAVRLWDWGRRRLARRHPAAPAPARARRV